MTPASRRRCRRSVTAGADRPTRRPSSARLSRASACNSPRRRRLTASSRESSAFCPMSLCSNCESATMPSLSAVIVPHHQASCCSVMPTKRREPPPHVYFVVSAVFHYLGPAFAVLLFARVSVLGVAWLRIAAAALVFAAWRRPWRAYAVLDGDGRRLLLCWGAVLAAMNACFYMAIDRLPLATVAAIEFLPVIALAALGVRSPRNAAALAGAVAGVWLLTDVVLAGSPLGV